MAVLGRLLVSSAERLDLPDLLSLDSYAAGDWKYFLKGLVGDSKPFILKGFDVIDPGNAIGTQSCSIRVADSITFYPGSNSGSFYHGLQEGHPQAAPLVPELRKNAVNYVYLTFSTFNTSIDTRAFWDPDKDGGAGGEFTQDVNTESVLKVEVNVSTGSFPANTVPVAKVTVGPVVITAIEDARDLMFRLGSGGVSPNPFNTYGWRSLPANGYERTEPPTTMQAGGVNPFQGADKNILTLKEWMDAVMSKLRELGGTTYWYDDTSSFSIVTNFYDAVATAFKSKGKWVHDTTTPGLLTWTEDIQIKMTSDPRTYIIRQGSEQLDNEQVMYIAMQRNLPFNSTDESVSWVNGQVYVNTVGGAVGLFANLSQGDYIKKAADPIGRWVRVEEFYDAVNNGGSTTTAAGARSVRISGPYLGTTGVEKGRYDKGAYQPADLVVSDRDDAAIANTGGNFHWLALRSDTINNIYNIITTNLTVAISEHDGSTAKVFSNGHGLVDADYITITGTTNFNGTYQIEVEDGNVFYINKSGGPFADQVGAAHCAIVTTSARVSPYGFQEESSNHGFNSNDTIQIAGTTNYNGAYKINVLSPNSFNIAVPSAIANESAGTATLAKIIVRTEGSVQQLIQGQVINIGGDVAENIRLYIGMDSLSQTAPNYTIPPDYNTLEGMQNYNGIVGDNLTVRVAKLTAMMADKAQDKTLQFLPSSGITEITNTTNGAAQELRFVPDGASLTIATPSSNGQTFMALPGSATPISLLQNQCAYITIDRNNPSTVTWTVADIVNVPLEENTLIVATRINTPDIYIWDATLTPSGSIPPPSFLTTIVQQNNTLKLVRGGTWSWGGGGLAPGNIAENNSGGGASVDFTGPGTNMYGQRFLATQNGEITSAQLHLKGASPSGNITLRVYDDAAGFPGTLLGTSDAFDSSTLYTGATLPYPAATFTFSTPVTGIIAGNNYHIVLRTDTFTGSLIEFEGNSSDLYSDGYVVFSNNNGASWSDLSPEDYEFSVDGNISAAADTLTWDADAYISIVGLTEGRNTILADSATLASDGDVAYVSINRSPGADANLTVTVAQIDAVPLGANTVIIARRVGADILVGSHSMLLVSDESKTLDSGMSDQNLTFIGATGEADNAPAYSSNFYVADGDSLTTAIGDLDAALNTLSGAVSAIQWKAPVANFAALPGSGNTNGDVRLTLDTGLMYTWKSSVSAWLQSGTFKAPVATFASLPATNNADGDVRIVLDTRLMYSWVTSLTQWIPVSGSGGSVKATFLDPISTTLPTGSSVTIDGVAGANDDLVLFTNLSSGNNIVYKLSGVGTSISWSPELLFNGSSSPSSGDSVRVIKGNAFAQQLAVFNGTNFKVNDVVRYFDGVSGNFWEQSSIKTSTLADNTTGNIFTVAYSGSENMIVNYSLIRGSIKETGQLMLTTDGTTVAVSRASAYLGTSGVTFTAQISGSDILLDYATTSLGSAATLKYFVNRWSDAAGGPTGIPSYSGGGGGGGSAAGINTDIQYNNAGTLAGDSRFQWDSANAALDLNNLQFVVLSSSIVLNDNQIAPGTVFSYNASNFRFAIVEYSSVRNGDYRVGRMLISNNGTTTGFSDDFVETSSTGLNFSATISGANVVVEYTSTATGFTSAFKYTVRRWN